jgi:hypothetical protein
MVLQQHLLLCHHVLHVQAQELLAQQNHVLHVPVRFLKKKSQQKNLLQRQHVVILDTNLIQRICIQATNQKRSKDHKELEAVLVMDNRQYGHKKAMEIDVARLTQFNRE